MKTTGLISFLAILFIFSSCVSSKKYDELMSQKTGLDTMLEDMKVKVTDLEAEIESLHGDKTVLIDAKEKLEGEIAALEGKIDAKSKVIEDWKTKVSDKDKAIADLRSKIKSAFKTGGLSVSEKNDRLYVNFDKINFKSGSSRLSKAERAALQSISSILNSHKGISMLVEGHTDSRKVRKGFAYKDNWELSMGRAMSVVNELMNQGVEPVQLSAVGRGDSMPLVSVSEQMSDPNEAHEMNRRVELVILADISDLYRVN